MGEEEVKEGFDVMWSLVEDAFRYSNESCLDIPPDLSLKDFFTEKLATLRLPPEQKNQILLLAEVWGSFIGDSWERQSLRWFWMEECLDGGNFPLQQKKHKKPLFPGPWLTRGSPAALENLFVADTHGPIIARIAEKALAHATLHLSTIVTSIESTTNPVGDPRVAIKTANNGHFEFDEVVVTVPLGCLKRSTPVFSPPLPPRITRAIHNASYCSLDKVYLTFPRAFWDGPAPAPSNPQDPTPSTPLPPFVHFLHPTTYIPSPAAACTLEMAPLSSPTAFGPRHAQPTLLFYTYGPCTEHLSALVRGLPRSSPDYLAALAGFLRPFYSRLRHYDAADAACAPTGAVFSDFRADALAGNGCYTNFQVGAAVAPGAAGEGEAGGQVLLDEDVRAMRAGVPGCGVWLAGEHVAPFVGLGTTTGAYWSGEAAGMRVLAAHGMVKGGARESSEASETESGAGEREK